MIISMRALIAHHLWATAQLGAWRETAHPRDYVCNHVDKSRQVSDTPRQSVHASPSLPLPAHSEDTF